MVRSWLEHTHQLVVCSLAGLASVTQTTEEVVQVVDWEGVMGNITKDERIIIANHRKPK